MLDELNVQLIDVKQKLRTRDRLQAALSSARQRLAQERARCSELEAELKKESADVAKLEGLSLTLEERASEEGHLFGSVSATTIREALAAQGIRIEEKQIQLESHIKELGIFNVPIRLDSEHTVALRIWVVEPGV